MFFHSHLVHCHSGFNEAADRDDMAVVTVIS